MLSAGDLKNVNAANAHFGTDILASLLNEPIPGQGVFWSSAGSRQYPVPMRGRSFEAQHPLQDPDSNRDAVATYAQELRTRMRSIATTPQTPSAAPSNSGRPKSSAATADAEPQASEGDVSQPSASDSDSPDGVDVLQTIQNAAIEAFAASQVYERVQTDGAAWGSIKAFFLDGPLPKDLHDRDQIAFDLVRPALDKAFGEEGWKTFKKNNTTWAKAIDGS